MESSEFKCKWMDKKDLWDIVEKVRNDYWPEEKLPVNTEQIVEFRLGLEIDPKHSLLIETDMDAYLKMDLSGIVVDYDKYMDTRYVNRMRFSFAHELGHYFLHREIYLSLQFSSYKQWKEFILDIPDREYSSFEWQANEFAGRLLVPYGELKTEVNNIIEVIKENNLIPYLKKDPDAVLPRVSTLIAKPFGVSTNVIETRVKREELWPPEI